MRTCQSTQLLTSSSGAWTGLELAPDHLIEREAVVVETLIDLFVDLLVAEGLGDLVEEVRAR